MMATNCCPGCSGSLVPLASDARLAKCQSCGGLVTLAPVSMNVATMWVRLTSPMSTRPDMNDARYFDLDVVDAVGDVRRFHGWYDTTDGKVLQQG